MKKIMLFFALFFSSFLFSQPIINLEHFDKNRLQWGYYFGINTLDFKFDYVKFDYLAINSDFQKDIQVKKSSGFNVGLTGDVRLFEHLNFRFEPGLIYNKRELNFTGFTEARHQVREVNSTYIYMPLLLKYSTKRWYNFKPYVTGGFSATINLSSHHKSTADNTELRFRTVQTTYFYEIGIGLDFYTPNFRFSPSIRGMFSVNNELIHDNNPNSPWTGNLNGIYTRAIMLNLTFE